MNGSVVSLLFYCITLEIQIVWKIHCFRAIGGNIEMLKTAELQGINLKHFASPKQRSAWRKLFSPPPDKSFLPLWNKTFQTKINRDIKETCFPSASRMQILGDYKWCSANVLSDTNQNNVFGCVAEKYFLQCWVS